MNDLIINFFNFGSIFHHSNKWSKMVYLLHVKNRTFHKISKKKFVFGRRFNGSNLEKSSNKKKAQKRFDRKEMSRSNVSLCWSNVLLVEFYDLRPDIHSCDFPFTRKSSDLTLIAAFCFIAATIQTLLSKLQTLIFPVGIDKCDWSLYSDYKID